MSRSAVTSAPSSLSDRLLRQGRQGHRQKVRTSPDLWADPGMWVRISPTPEAPPRKVLQY